MRYMCLIYTNESNDAARSEDEQGEIMQGYMAFTEEVRGKGVMEAGDPLMPTDTATTVRVEGGQTANIDGPFAETREQLGGYYILDCANLDEALGYAAKIPAASHGSIEVRPIMDLPGGSG